MSGAARQAFACWPEEVWHKSDPGSRFFRRRGPTGARFCLGSPGFLLYSPGRTDLRASPTARLEAGLHRVCLMKRMNANVRTVVVTVLVTLMVVLVLQNLRGATVRFIVWDLAMPQAALVLLAFALGWAMHWFWRGR